MSSQSRHLAMACNYLQSKNMSDLQKRYNVFAAHMEKLFSAPTCSVPGMRMTEIVYSLCSCRPIPMHDFLFTNIANFIESHSINIQKNISQASQENTLFVYSDAWYRFYDGSMTLNAVCGSLNKIICDDLHRIPIASGLKATHDSSLVGSSKFSRQNILSLCLSLWRENVFLPSKNLLLSLALNSIFNSRNNVPSDPTPCRLFAFSLAIMQSKVENSVNIYIKEFESLVLEETQKFYIEQRIKSYTSIEDYVLFVHSKVLEEEERSKNFFHPDSVSKVVFECLFNLLGDKVDEIQNSFYSMLTNNRKDSAKCSYYLFRRSLNDIDILSNIYGKFVANHLLLNEWTDPSDFVNRFSDFYNARQQEINDLFDHDKNFTASVTSSLRFAINTHLKRISEMLAKYSDWVISMHSELSSDEIEQCLKKLFLVVLFLDDKDIFKQLYSQLHAQRLVRCEKDKSPLELVLLDRLKIACGADYINNMERLHWDFDNSRQLNNQLPAEFKNSCKTDFSVQVFSNSAWPIVKTFIAPKEIPAELLRIFEQFSLFYDSKNPSKKLLPLWNLCRVDILLSVLQKSYSINMSLFQFLVFSKIIEKENFAVKDASDILELGTFETKQLMKPLQDIKLILLVKSENFEYFTFVRDFSHVETNIIVKSVSIEHSDSIESLDELKELDETSEASRLLFLQSCISSFLKREKIQSFSSISKMAIAAASARFIATNELIEKALETLIEKNYVKPSDSNTDEYCYIP